MSDPAAAPFTGYNQSTSPVRTLVGNFYEERALLSATGVARRRPVMGSAAAGTHDAATLPAAAADEDLAASIFPSPEERAANAVQPPTFKRVIEHSEREEPADWTSHAQGAFQPPTKLTAATSGSHHGVPAAGPRELEDLVLMRAQASEAAAAEAAAREAAAAIPPSSATTYSDYFGPQGPPASGEGSSGGGVAPGSLAEQRGRMLTRQPAFRRRAPAASPSATEAPDAGAEAASWAGATGVPVPAELDTPVTFYTWGQGGAPAGASTAGTAAGAGSLKATSSPKASMGRRDRFTKLRGDVNLPADDEDITEPIKNLQL